MIIVGISVFLLLSDAMLQYFDINIRFVSDLSLDAYILFITAALLYVKTQKNMIVLFNQIQRKGKTIYWKHILPVLIISLLVSLLAFPLVGIHIAGVIAYICYCYFSRQFDGKYAFIIALIFLIFCPFFIILKQDPLSESFAIFSFYFMILGTFQEGIRLAGVKKYDIEKLFSGIKEGYKQGSATDKSFTNELHINDGFIHAKTSFYPHAFDSNIVTPFPVYKIVLPSILLLILCIVGYVLYLYAPKWSLTIPFTRQEPTMVPSLSPTIFITPTVTIVSAFSMSSDSAKLKIKIENGTKISGLAASTSAILKEVGFKDIKTGDTGETYKNWEISLRKEDPDLVQFIKSTLSLETIDVKQATGGASFDIVIIAGENK